MPPTRIVFRDNIQNPVNNSNIRVIILTNADNDMEISDCKDDESETENVVINMNTCSICHDVMETNIVKTECGHKYHKSCLISWIGSDQRRRLKCPICIQSLSL